MSALTKFFLRSIGLVGLLAGAFACTTLPSYLDVQLPAYASAFFVECSSLDGALSFQLKRDSAVVDAVDLEWAAKANGDWGLASYSPLGQTLFQIKFAKDDQNFAVTGAKEEWLKELGISPNGFLRYQEQKLGLRPDEFPCFWAGRLPRAWLRQVFGLSQDSEGLLLRIQDQERKISVRIAKHGGSSPWIWQVNIDWDLYWGFKHHSLQLQSKRDQGVVLLSESIKDLECLWVPKLED